MWPICFFIPFEFSYKNFSNMPVIFIIKIKFKQFEINSEVKENMNFYLLHIFFSFISLPWKGDVICIRIFNSADNNQTYLLIICFLTQHLEYIKKEKLPKSLHLEYKNLALNHRLVRKEVSLVADFFLNSRFVP